MISFIEDIYNCDNDDNYYVISQEMWVRAAAAPRFGGEGVPYLPGWAEKFR